MKYLGVSKVFVNTIMGVLVLLMTSDAMHLIFKSNSQLYEKIIGGIIILIFYIGLLILSSSIRRIVKNIEMKKIFVDENIKLFNYISYCIFGLAAITCFVNNNGDRSLLIISVEGYFAIKTETLVMIALGFLSKLLGEIFKEASEIKNRAEVLEEESKYTI